jgi:hypothetical protein
MSMAVAALAVAVAAAPSAAHARNLPMSEAKRAATAAVAPAPVVAVRCFRPALKPSGLDRKRALCLVGHPLAPGALCRSLVMVKAPRGYGAARARVIRQQICSTFRPIEV